MKFENLNKEILKSLSEMGFEEMTPIQENAIPTILTGKDFIGISHTGTGKTCAFSTPIIENIEDSKKIEYIVLCPTRELVIQTCEEMKKIGKYVTDLKVVPIYGGQQIEKQIMALRKKPNVVVATPGRLMDHMRKKTIKLDNIKMLILDEADEMLNMGFREDLDVILSNVKHDMQKVLFSATMSKDILNITKKYLKEDAVKYVVEHKEVNAPKISQYVVKVNSGKKMEALTRILDNEDLNLAVIFCNTKRMVDELVSNLQTRGYLCSGLHSDVKQSQRDVIMKKFKSGKINILIATDVAARGIDADGVEVVFNYDLPMDEEFYVHRIGRTGRAGKEGKSISFVASRDLNNLRNLEKFLKKKLEDYEIPSNEKTMNKKYDILIKEANKIILAGNLDRELEMVEEYLSNNEVSLVEFTASLIQKIVGPKEVEKLIIKDKFEVEEGKKRLFITLGKKDGINKNSLRDYIVEACDVNRSFIHGCEVLDKFAFLTVSNDIDKDIISKLNGNTYNGRKICIEESKGTKNSKSVKTEKNFKDSKSSKSNRGNKDFKRSKVKK